MGAVRALSIRQPWAWAIVRGYKPDENRSWYAHGPYPFRCILHASKLMTADSVVAAMETFHRNGVDDFSPDLVKHLRGGIVGIGTITGYVLNRDNPTPWRAPDGYSFQLSEVEELPFLPMAGGLSFFRIHDYEVSTAIARERTRRRDAGEADYSKKELKKLDELTRFVSLSHIQD